MKTVLTIAGFDPSSGAGVTADLMVFAAHGLYGTSAITALTVQSTFGVEASYPVESSILSDTLASLTGDLPPAGVKIGMIASFGNTCIISKYIHTMKHLDAEQGGLLSVLDPVLISSSGRKLLDIEGISALKSELLQQVDWVTPNVDELTALSGQEIQSLESLAAGARELQKQVSVRPDGSKIGIFAKGGHLEQPNDFLLTPDGQEHWLPGERLQTTATHGTGCALSSAFLSRLVLGNAPIDAARKAKDYVAEAMRQAPEIGHGKGPLGLLWPLRAQPRR